MQRSRPGLARAQLTAAARSTPLNCNENMIGLQDGSLLTRCKRATSDATDIPLLAQGPSGKCAAHSGTSG